MPYLPTSIKGFSQLKASSKLMSGSKLPDLVAAIAGACSQYILSVSTVNSTNIALGPGAGTQTGKITGLVPTAMSSLMMLKSTAFGLSGRDIKKFYDSISFGVVNASKAIVMQGAIIGAGPGTGTGKIVGLVPKGLESLIFGQTSFRLLSGSKLRTMISCVAFGVCNHIMTTATVSITNIGVAAGPPVGPILIPVAPGVGRLV